MPMWLHNTLQKLVKELLKADSASSIYQKEPLGEYDLLWFFVLWFWWFCLWPKNQELLLGDFDVLRFLMIANFGDCKLAVFVPEVVERTTASKPRTACGNSHGRGQGYLSKRRLSWESDWRHAITGIRFSSATKLNRWWSSSGGSSFSKAVLIYPILLVQDDKWQSTKWQITEWQKMTNLQENDKKMPNKMTNLQVAKMALFSRSYHILLFVIYVCDFSRPAIFLQTKWQTKIEITIYIFFSGFSWPRIF